VKRIVAVAAVIGTLLVAACGNGDDGQGPFEIVMHPEFVQGALPGVPVTLLVTVEDTEGGSGEVSLSADFSAGTATVNPTAITAGEIAEVTLAADAVDEETEGTVGLTAVRGTVERTVSRPVVVMPVTDELGPLAQDLLAVFTTWLADSHPELEISPQRGYRGSIVAPRLLEVSHYVFMDSDYELGLSWHVTIQPHDWAELYVRPRDSLRPTQAFSVSSWSAALAGGEVDFTEVAPPEEIVR
jgi:hypothetical protein